MRRIKETKHLLLKRRRRARKRRRAKRRRRETPRGSQIMRLPRRWKGLLMITNPEGKAVRVLSGIYKF